MTLTDLRYLVTLGQEQHFGRAAKRCNVSQPTLSVAINKLESRLAVTLFERLPQKIRITDIGEKILAQAAKILQEMALLQEIAQQGQSQLGAPLRIGAIYTIAPYLFPSLIPQLKQLASAMPLVIEEDYTANLRSKLQRGELDVIFIALPFEEPGVVTKALYDESFVALLPKEHCLSQEDVISNDHMAEQDVLLLGEGHCFRDQILQACPDCYKDSDEQLQSQGTSLETLRHMVASGLGVTILPNTATQIANYNDMLCVKPFADKALQRTVAMAWRMSFHRTKAINVLMDALKSCDIAGIDVWH